MNLEKAVEELKEKVKRGENVKSQFWRIVGAVKRSEKVDERILMELASIRDEIFDKDIVFPAKIGNILFPALFLLFNVAFFIAALTKASFILKVIVLFLLETTVVYFSFLTGRIVGAKLTGIKIESYYRYNPLELGMKLDLRSYLSVSQKRRVLFFLTPILFEHIVLLIHFFAFYLLKIEVYWIPMLFVIVNVPFSYLIYRMKKTGELYRFLRELKILKELSEKPPAERN